MSEETIETSIANYKARDHAFADWVEEKKVSASRDDFNAGWNARGEPADNNIGQTDCTNCDGDEAMHIPATKTEAAYCSHLLDDCDCREYKPADNIGEAVEGKNRTKKLLDQIRTARQISGDDLNTIVR